MRLKKKVTKYMTQNYNINTYYTKADILAMMI